MRGMSLLHRGILLCSIRRYTRPPVSGMHARWSLGLKVWVFQQLIFNSLFQVLTQRSILFLCRFHPLRKTLELHVTL